MNFLSIGGIILIVACIGIIVWYVSSLKDQDGDGDIDFKDAKITAEEIHDDLKEGVEDIKETAKEIKRRAKNVKKEIKDVVEQTKDVVDAVKGQKRRGRKPKAKK